MPKKTIRVAVWEYRNAAGKRRLAYFGNVVDLPASEIERGEALDVFGAPVVETEVEVETADPDTQGGDGEAALAAAVAAADAEQAAAAKAAATAKAATGERPQNVAGKAVWDAYGVANGLTAEEVGEMTKAQINAAVEAKKAQA